MFDSTNQSLLIRFCACVFALAFVPCMAAHGSLVHRYSFDDGTANDSIGTAHGSIVGSATITDGELDTSSGGFVELPSTATQGLDSSFTIELWYTWFGPGGAQISFSFGPSTSGYLLSHPSWNGGHTMEYRPGGLLGGSIIGAAPRNTPIHLVTTYDATSGTALMYVDGSLVNDSLSSVAFDLESLGSQIDVGGRGPFNDPSLNGTIDEFRIWDNALTESQITNAFALGPNTVIPEPASLALLGLGGLTLLRRTNNRKERN